MFADSKLHDGKRPLEKTFCRTILRGILLEEKSRAWNLLVGPASLSLLSDARDFGRGRPPRSKPKPVGLDQACVLHLGIAFF